MPLPIQPPYPPMEAKLVESIPEGEGWQYEPKWDGFRCLAFRDGDKVELQSKAGQPLGRYFPEVVEAVAALPAKRFVLDGEIVVPVGRRCRSTSYCSASTPPPAGSASCQRNSRRSTSSSTCWWTSAAPP